MHDSIPSVRAEAVHAALDWRSLVDALREPEASVPTRDATTPQRLAGQG